MTMGLAWMVVVAVATVLASWAFNTLVYLVWRPRAITRQLRAQGVGGPAYKFLAGNLAEIKQLRAKGAGAALVPRGARGGGREVLQPRGL